MRQSKFFAPTLRTAKADNEAHALLLRGGYVRQLAAGIYSYLPLGLRVLSKVEGVVRQEMDGAGAVELLMPALSPAELWRETGRDSLDILFNLQDGKGSDYLLAPTHEEVVTDIVRGTVSSYKQLPLTLYQIQTKFRDEPRPRAGLLRGREFVMKDAYSFDADLPGLDRSFDAMVEAYKRIFARCGLATQIVDAAGGGIGGFDTKEFMALSASGEDLILFNESDGYAANLELANSRIQLIADRTDIGDDVEQFATPDIKTIDALAQFEGGAEAVHQIKTLVFVADDKPVLALLRGDHQLVEAKLSAALGAARIRPATPDEIHALLGAHPGSLGAVGVNDVPILADEALRGRTRMTTGANRDGFHLRGVAMQRDVPAAQFFDLREAREGEMSPLGGGALSSAKAIELGHVFKLGNKYSKAMGAQILDSNGKAQIMEMGCYGIGVSRIVAAIADACRDDRGPIWPREVAPFAVHLLLLEKEEAVVEAAETLYRDLRAAGFDVLFDDRKESPGIKFADADLIGAPVRITAGRVTKENGAFELRTRANKEADSIPANEVVGRVREMLS